MTCMHRIVWLRALCVAACRYAHVKQTVNESEEVLYEYVSEKVVLV